MPQLIVQAGENRAQLDTSANTISEYKATLPHPIEIEAFGPQFFLSIMGTSIQVLITLFDVNGEVIETDKYELKFG